MVAIKENRMAVKATEALNPNAAGLDLQPPAIAARLLSEAQAEAASVVAQAASDIARAAELVADALGGGGRLVYAAAGSSGLMALADALELPGTYGIPLDRIVVLIAGGQQALVDLAGAPEDDGDTASALIGSHGVGPGDCLIALSASGSTAYAVGALEAARSHGASTIGIANNSGTPLVVRADIGIVLPTPPEMVAGSTRMGAGTAQKIALNMLSTLAAIRLGHVHDGLMVNLKADNMKLRDRAARIVASIAGCTIDAANTALHEAGGAVKPAVLIAAGARDRPTAEAMLASTRGQLRPALAELTEGSARSHQNRA
jgi:N-acetylmuramic acid 6-phosphate etherase